MSINKTIIALSGGIDSTTLLLDLYNQDYEIIPVIFNYGQTKDEILAALDLCDMLQLEPKCIDLRGILPILPNQFIIPNRNAVFINILWSHAIKENCKWIAIGATKSDYGEFPDCRPEFFEALESTLIKGSPESDIRIATPYIHKRKSEVIKILIENCSMGYDVYDILEDLRLDAMDILKITHSSYDDKVDGKATGATISDEERIKAFEELGIEDPIEYL